MSAVRAPRRAVLDRCRLPGASAALGAACSILAIAGPATAVAADCAPPGQQRSASIARADKADGTSEVTESLPGGAYRVTRCAGDGRLLVSQTVSPIRDPDGGVVLVPTEREEPGVSLAALYGDPEEPSCARAFRADRAALLAAVIPPTVPLPAPPLPAGPVAPGPSEAGEPGATGKPDPRPQEKPARSDQAFGGQLARAAVSGDACTNSQYAPFGGRWVGRAYDYVVNRSRFSYNDTSVASIVSGHRNWDTTYNGCGLNDITNLNSRHVGSTALTIHSYPDGASVVDKGNLASVGCAGALACTWLFSSGGASSETDQRYNESISFSNVGAAGAYDYQAIATHESGHGIGLDHANSSNALTMYYAIGSGTTHPRSLAKGDVLGLRARYP